jgi:GPH family glycoside/pentoside/hexuronide:cation symporter
MHTPKLTVLEKIGFGAGDASVNVVISSFFLLINFFYTDIFGLRPEHIIALLFVGRVIDAVTDPLMGLITDKVETRFGRYRPYFLWLAVPFGISVFLAYSTPDFDYNMKLVYAYATYILVTLVFTAVTIPYISIIGVLTDDPKERLSANGYRLFFAKVAALLVSTAVPIVAGWFGENLARGYQVAMGTMGALATLLFLFCFATTTERVRHKPDPRPVVTQLRPLLRNDQWLLLCAVCIIGTVGYVVRGSVAIYYATYYLGGSAAMQSSFMGTGVFAAILAMIASTWMTKVVCKIQLFRWTQIGVAVISVLFYLLVQPGDVALAFVLYFVLCFVVDLHAPVFWSIIPEAVDYGEAKSGQRTSGLSFGGISFCQKMGMALAGAIVNGLLVFFAYEANQVQTPETQHGIHLMLTVIPGGFHLLMGCVMFFYKINDRYYARIKNGTVPGLQPLRSVVKD